MKIVLNDKLLPLKDCIKFKDKLLGFMFKKNIDSALRFKCKAIHTFFMKEKIDVVITDKNNKVIQVKNNMNKNKILINFKAYYFYELPKSTNTYKDNDIVNLSN